MVATNEVEVGTAVRVVLAGHCLEGGTGYVRDVVNNLPPLMYDVTFAGRGVWLFLPEEIELAE